ncbi:hypothetical protein EDC14_101964 [Hydrogenispora ethanolica]|uniref:Uncharacterized protein n=1 Tax=Hydrogenispora ethanolica TaxID=1082276 RepID=A0A4R1REC0_HYDET|nr:hypothetical protein EDC14_101964 [Hydrogenispora ethanolica]
MTVTAEIPNKPLYKRLEDSFFRLLKVLGVSRYPSDEQKDVLLIIILIIFPAVLYCLKIITQYDLRVAYYFWMYFVCLRLLLHLFHER